MLLLPCTVPQAMAQTPPAKAAGTRFEILDNSFLVEEAFNQEAGVFQNIFGVRFYEGAEWDFGFTQEWPVGSQAHQFSYTIPVSRVGGETGFGDVLINYRYQALAESTRRPAFSPRVSVILPSGRKQDGLGAGGVGWQVNLPFSKQRGDLYFHWNAGFTWLPGIDSADDVPRSDDGRDRLTPHLAGSTIWAALPMFHLVLETVAEFEERVDTLGMTSRATAFTLSPGLRGGWNVGDRQIIVGFAVPVSFAGDATGAGAFLYFSYELPFKR